MLAKKFFLLFNNNMLTRIPTKTIKKMYTTLNTGYNIPKIIQENHHHLKRHNRFFVGQDMYTMDEKTNMIGKCINDLLFEFGINEDTLNAVKYYINRLKRPDVGGKASEKSQLINIIYSTIIKKIMPKHLIRGKISSDSYVSFVNDSIQNYKEHPVNGVIDYRHIAGRMLSLKMLSKAVLSSLGSIPKKLRSLKWTVGQQLDYMEIMDKISKVEDLNKGFVISNGFRFNFIKKERYTKEEHLVRVKENIADLLRLIHGKLEVLISDPKRNKSEIEDLIDYAYIYYDKIPYTDPEIKKFMRLMRPIKEIEKEIKLLNKK